MKDIFAVKDLPWRCGSPIWADRVATFDAPSVALARSGGAVVLGKTETTEFAGYTPCRTHNPVVSGASPGGSSSGSAAAVAAGMVPLAFGSQTSGSVIRPASFCGVVGFKPSFDVIEPSGVAPLARSFDTVGLFARSVGDIALALEALSGLDLRPSSDAVAPRPVGLFRSSAWAAAEPALVDAWQRFETDIENAPVALCDAVPADLARELTEAPALHARIMAVETGEALAFEAGVAWDLLSDGLRGEIETGRAMSASRRAADRQALHGLRMRAFACLDPQAVWLTPAACGAAPARETSTGDPAFNRTWSLLGLPACTVPLLHDVNGAPIGVQVVGAMGNDAGVLAVADWLMRYFQVGRTPSVAP